MDFIRECHSNQSDLRAPHLEPLELVQHKVIVPGGMPVRPLGLYLLAIQESSEILIYADNNG